MSIEVKSEVAVEVRISGEDVERLAKVCSIASIPRNMDEGGEHGPEYRGAVDFAMTLGMAIQERKRYPDDLDFQTIRQVSANELASKYGAERVSQDMLTRTMIRHAVLAEREACAKIAEYYNCHPNVANSIRERK